MSGELTVGKKAVRFGYRRYGIPGAIAAGGIALVGYVAARRALDAAAESERINAVVDVRTIQTTIEEEGLDAVIDPETLDKAIDPDTRGTAITVDDVHPEDSDDPIDFSFDDPQDDSSDDSTP